MSDEEGETSGKKQRAQGGYSGTEMSPGAVDMVDTSGAAGYSTFPSLAFAIFIETASVDLVKTCRLVCKSWNHAACNVLRARSCVSLFENEKRCKDFRKLIFVGEFSPEIPSPFQNVKAYGDSFTNEWFKSILHIPHLVIETLILPLGTNTDQKELEKLLVAKGPRIKFVVINVDDDNRGFTPDTALLANEQIKLPGLKHLQLWEMCPHRNLNNIALTKKLIQYSALEIIVLKITDANILDQILTPVNLLTVKMLKLILSRVSTEDFEHLQNLRMPSLRDLEVRVDNMSDEVQEHHPNDGQLQQIASFVGNVSSTIKVLTSNVLRWKLLPVCPKLEEIHILELDGGVPDFTVASFPALESIHVRVKAIWTLQENTFIIPHPKVTNIDIDLVGSPLDQLMFADSSLYSFLKCLSILFPNIEKLALGKNPSFSPITFREINQVFPRLKALKINSSCDFDSMTGMKKNYLRNHVTAGRPIKNDPRRNSIFAFRALESLDLVGLVATITNEMIIHCLAKIPTLKSVKFYWNHRLHSHHVRDCLVHLEKILIINLFQQVTKRHVSDSEIKDYVTSISVPELKHYFRGISELDLLPNVLICRFLSCVYDYEF